MSEEAKLVYIQMRMKEIERMEHISNAGLWVGVLLAFVGFAFAGLGFLTTNGLWLGVVGIIVAAGEFYSYALNSYQYFKLKQELKTMTEAPPSPWQIVCSFDLTDVDKKSEIIKHIIQ